MDAFCRDRVVPGRLGTVPQVGDLPVSEKAGDQSKTHGAGGSETAPVTMTLCCWA